MDDLEITNGTANGTGGISGTPAPATPAPAAAQTSTQPPPPAGSPSQASTGLTGGEPSGTPFSVREALRSSGINVPDNVDDRAAIGQLIQTHQQAQQAQQELAQARQLAQYGQLYVQHADQFQQYLRQQQEQQRQQQTNQQKPWWDKYWQPPEYNQAWERLLERDPVSGQLRTIPGADPTVLPKYLAYEQYRRQQVEKLTSNPFEYIQEPVQHLARQIAQEVVQQHLTTYQDNLFSDQFVHQNASWLVQKDAQGRPVVSGRDPQTGRPIPALTPEGQAFASFVVQAERMGIRDVRAQKDYATAMLERELAMHQINQQKTGQVGQQQKQDFLQQAAGANHIPGQSGTLQHAQNGNAPSQNPALSLAERLRQAFKENGINDETLQPA